jgi:hypothetical protein
LDPIRRVWDGFVNTSKVLNQVWLFWSRVSNNSTTFQQFGLS